MISRSWLWPCIHTQLHRIMIRFTCWCFVFWFDQAFYPTNKDVNVNYGDTLAARCMFTGENMTTATSIGWVNIPIKLLTSILALCEHFSELHGLFWVVRYHLVCLYLSTLQPHFLFSCRSTSNDEMCNFYIMYYMDRKHAIPFMSCMNPGPKQLFQHIPAEANIPIPVSPDMMHSGHMMHSAHVSGTKIICWFCCRMRVRATAPLTPCLVSCEFRSISPWRSSGQFVVWNKQRATESGWESVSALLDCC